MTFFDWFMAIIGIVSTAMLIFWIVCEMKPSLLKNNTVRFLYNFIVGTDDVYETD